MKTPLPRSPTAGLRSFVGRVALFLLPLAVAAALLVRTPLSRPYAWFFVRSDSEGHGVWVRDRITASPVPIDVAFVGTSRTLLGIADEQIEDALVDAGRTWHVTNLGVPRSGRNQHYVVTRDLLDTREVRHLLVEVGNDEHRGSHPLFGYVARTDDLLGAPIVPDTYFVQDVYHGLLSRVGERRRELLAMPIPPMEATVHPHGEPRWLKDGRAPPAELDAAWQRRHERAAKRGAPTGGRTRRPRTYLRAIADEAARHGTQVHFLYLPSYGWPWAELGYGPLYGDLGDVWIPPEEIFRDKTSWLDPYHLNREGAVRLSAWVAEKLRALP